MKITAIQTSNFIGARDIDVKLTKPVTLFAGKNFAGKSSLQEAVRMALTGESVRVGLKKEYGALITDGQETGFVQVDTDDSQFSIVLPAGKGVHFENTALPYVLDAQRFAQMTTEHRRAFLFGLMGLRTDGAAVKDRLTARGCNAAKVEHVAPLLRAGFDAGQKEAQAKAREAKASWKTTTGGEAYGSNKAASWAAAKPEADAGKLEQARADLAAIEAELEAETGRLGELQGRARHVAEKSGKLAELREKAGRYARIQDKLIKDEAELKQWESKVETARQRASGGRKVGLVHDLAYSLNEALRMAIPFGEMDANQRKHLADASAALEKYSAEHGSIESGATADTEAVGKLPEYEKAMRLMESCVANGKRDLAAADAAAAALRELEDSGMTEAPGEEEITTLANRIAALKHSRTNQQAGIRMLEDAARQAAQADEKTTRAAALHQDVQEWEAIADALAPDGIPGEMLAEALGPINDRMAISSATSEWSPVKIDAGMNITADGRAYALLSESEKWRADAMIAEAVSYLSKLRILVLDRFDVLDLKGREDLLCWLEALAEDNEIDTALIFGTLKALPAQLPETIGAVWIDNGVAGRMKEAA